MSDPTERIAIQRGGDANTRNDTVDWALGVLERALAARSIALGEGAATTIRLASGSDADADAAQAGVTLPRRAEAFALFRSGDDIVAWGFDRRGIGYAITELADRLLDTEGELFGKLPLVEEPKTRIRAVSRAFCSEVEDKPWLYDRSGWIKYLDMLATNRFNRIAINLGIGYDYPYHNNILSDVYLHFAYPFLVDLPGHGIRVDGLPELERQQNLEAFKFIGREAARRGLDFQLGLWTERYDFDNQAHLSHQVLGVTEENLRNYCRDSVAFLLREIPEITGLTFRIHVEAGVAEGDYDFWRTVFSAVKQAGRRIELNLHAKGLDEHVLGAARDTGMPLVVAPKYLAEHMGLPYHPSAIREREYPPAESVTGREQLSTGSRRFTRQSYGDYLPPKRDWGVMFRIWPGTQRLLSWGDPAFAAAYGRSMSFCDADGFEWMEPMTFKGRQGTGIAGGRSGLIDPTLASFPEWRRHEYAFRLLGRLSYSPDIGPESWQRYLKAKLGAAAAAVEQAMGAASRILPLVTKTHGPSIANNCYWPEVYTNISGVGTFTPRPVGFDMDGPTRFGNAPSFDPQMFPSAKNYIEALLSGAPPPSYTPLDVADWLDGFAGQAEAGLEQLKLVPEYSARPVARYALDVEIMAAIGRFFAQKFRSACYAELMLTTRSLAAQRLALAHARLALAAWTRAANAGDRGYHRDNTFGPGRHMRGTWSARTDEVAKEANDIQVYQLQDTPTPTHSVADADRVIEMLATRQPVGRLPAPLEAPPSFRSGEAVTVAISAGDLNRATLHYRHVNQGERWTSLPMSVNGGRHVAAIPADYTASNDHLQVYVTAETAGGMGVAPGFPDKLAGTPYAVILQQVD
ncbi:MAG: hypothetical protein ACTHLT_20640 [Devosia sp.]